MKKATLLICAFITFVSFICVSAREDSNKFKDYVCVVDNQSEASVFTCTNIKNNESFTQEVPPLVELEITRKMQASGVQVVSYESYFEKTLMGTMNDFLSAGDPLAGGCFERIGYETNEFNRLPENHETIARIRELASVLKEAGVCNMPVKSANYLGVDIRNADDVLAQFLCISNSESTFGRDNIGQGGRGPWGIHPMHNLSNGVCYPSQAVVRDSSGKETKRNNDYLNRNVRLDNAKCALELYSAKGFRDWGTTNKWGSNRHCSKRVRDRLNFKKYLGELACCTQACKARVTNSI